MEDLITDRLLSFEFIVYPTLGVHAKAIISNGEVVVIGIDNMPEDAQTDAKSVAEQMYSLMKIGL